MSATLLQRVKTHIVDDGGRLSGFSVRYFRWLDNDLNGAGSVALFRVTGTEGQINRHVQFPDVSLFLLADSESAKSADDEMLATLRYLRANPAAAGAFTMFPIGTFTGPSYLQNGRAMFEMVIRVGTTDH